MAKGKSKRKKTLPQEELSNEILVEKNIEERPSPVLEVKVPEVKVPEVKVEKTLKVGDRVKVNEEIDSDILGRRIHNGIKNYLYTVKNVREDGYVTIECLTYIFTLPVKDLVLMQKGAK